jgi:hypothetical protein
VYLFYNVRPRADQDFVAAMKTAEIGAAEIERLDGGPHRAVEQQHAGFQFVQEA